LTFTQGLHSRERSGRYPFCELHCFSSTLCVIALSQPFNLVTEGGWRMLCRAGLCRFTFPFRRHETKGREVLFLHQLEPGFQLRKVSFVSDKIALGYRKYSFSS
jgi:hypothetical protein